jgi:hypothetical protein
LLGASVATVLVASLPSSKWATFIDALGKFTALGAGHAVVFWLVAVFKNNALPEKSAEKSVHNAT